MTEKALQRELSGISAVRGETPRRVLEPQLTNRRGGSLKIFPIDGPPRRSSGKFPNPKPGRTAAAASVRASTVKTTDPV